MLASIAICTLNRAPSLARTLESLVAMYPINEVEWEVVVVNNGCTDGTDEVIDSFATRLPIRRLLEPHGGLSRARNRAVDLITSSYIIWTDDDVVVDRRWLMSYVAAFRRSHHMKHQSFHGYENASICSTYRIRSETWATLQSVFPRQQRIIALALILRFEPQSRGDAVTIRLSVWHPTSTELARKRR
jgi:glycosyltransferase involved in cell wall biosynthesis